MTRIARQQARLSRSLGVPGATLLGLGSILGTGVFVSIGLAAGVTGPAVVLAVVLAAGVALCNALSAAQLAATHPVSGGAYEYGYQFLRPTTGFLAGWLFLLAKSASAATAALGAAGYVLGAVGAPVGAMAPLACAVVLGVTLLAAGGVRRSNRMNAAIVSFVVLALLVFAAVALSRADAGGSNWTPFFEGATGTEQLRRLLEATALMFVAYTGYGRVATMAEEVTEPRRTIPRAILATVAISAALYVLVAVTAVGAVGTEFLHEATLSGAAPLEEAARAFGASRVALFVAMGASVAMLAVLLNLVLGLSRVLLAMARRGDMPLGLRRIERAGETPRRAVVTMGLLIAGITLVGDVGLTWSFSAFTVLVYYAITNAAALALPARRRLYPRWVSWLGLASCLGLAFWVDVQAWIAGVCVSAVGLCWFGAARALRGRSRA